MQRITRVHPSSRFSYLTIAQLPLKYCFQHQKVLEFSQSFVFFTSSLFTHNLASLRVGCCSVQISDDISFQTKKSLITAAADRKYTVFQVRALLGLSRNIIHLNVQEKLISYTTKDFLGGNNLTLIFGKMVVARMKFKNLVACRLLSPRIKPSHI